MPALDGRVVALLENRKSEELAVMVQRQGGVVLSAPALRERPLDGDTAKLIDRLIDGDFRVAIFLTGAGASALFAEAERTGKLSGLLQAMRAMTVACRGPKPLGVLKRHGLAPGIVTTKPHTSAELLEELRSTPLDGVAVMLLHYGELSAALTESLAARGALVEDVCLYEWALPEDLEPLRELVRRTIAGAVDAVLFTSQIQFRFLMQIAAEMGEAEVLVRALNERAVVGAIGPVCASALRAGGVVADVLPASPTSASLVSAVSDYFDLTRPDARS